MLRLPLLDPHRAALETCVYCPKLSRAACPVSTVEANESVTPWGKMSTAYFVARGDAPIDVEHADNAWACSSCYACRERCDHKNEVATVLSDARAEYFARGLMPESAKRVVDGFDARGRALANALEALDGAAGSPSDTAVLLGCDYVLHDADTSRAALAAAENLTGSRARAVRQCCGLPLLHAGDRKGFVAAAGALAKTVSAAERFVVVDPGCARTLLVEAPRLGVEVKRPELFVDLAEAAIPRLREVEGLPPIRYHDPCQLGRGLGRYEAPRRILGRLSGRAPAEFQRRAEYAECSGGGGLLPVTRPETSELMAEHRVSEHRGTGHLLVTHCGSSLRSFRSRDVVVEDLATLVARALSKNP